MDIFNPFKFDEQVEKWSDPRSKEYPLMEKASTTVIIVALYLLIIYKIGPYFMKNRDAFVLKKPIILYNISQIFINGYICLKVSKHWARVSVWCVPCEPGNDPQTLDLIESHYFYTMLKFYDLIESFFYVLRKRPNQLSVLHVYHHVLLVVTMVAFFKLGPGGASFFVVFGNTLVHFIMYIYYSIALFKKTGIWWKKYLTLMQIIQQMLFFVVHMIHVLNVNCSYPKILVGWFNFSGLYMLGLFIKFYVDTYVKSKKLKT